MSTQNGGGPATWSTWATILFVLGLLGIAIAITLFGGQWLAKIAGELGTVIVPFAMTTGKHDLPPLSKGQIAFGVFIAILIIIVASITPPLP